MSDDQPEAVITKQTRVTVGMMLIIIAAVGFTVRASIMADDAKTKVVTLEASMIELAQAQLTSSLKSNQNEKKSDEHSTLLKKLGEVQIQNQLLMNTQKVELRYIKKGIEMILKKGG